VARGIPDWQPADEKGDDAQLLPVLRNGEIARLENPTIEDKETRPPPRYNEGTLIEAMQNAWRFVDDEVLRERLKEAKGIGTPATRAEIIGGLKKQGFLIAPGKNIVPTETGLSLFGVLKQADPALVDPGVTAQLECLLDEVVIGKQEMVGGLTPCAMSLNASSASSRKALVPEGRRCSAAWSAAMREFVHQRRR
jgi:DNA topoisomerase-3